MSAKYGRQDDEWDVLTEAGLAFVIERARRSRTTTYTELNTTLGRRTGLRIFDFDRGDDRAAMGHLLGMMVERSRPTTGLMISALVQYLDANDAGGGFYSLASDFGLLSRKATAAERMIFWIGQVNLLHRYYAPERVAK